MGYRLVVCVLLVVLCADSSKCISKQADNYRDMLFQKHLGMKLNLPIKQKTIQVNDEMHCGYTCVREAWCLAVNFNNTSDVSGLYSCEILSSDQYTSKTELQPDLQFVHLNIKHPCEQEPCLNEGVCQVLDNRHFYTCQCKKGFSGENCQIVGCKQMTTIGRCCVFPFVYLGVQYNKCTTVNYGSTPWCSYHHMYMGSWGVCK